MRQLAASPSQMLPLTPGPTTLARTLKFRRGSMVMKTFSSGHFLCTCKLGQSSALSLGRRQKPRTRPLPRLITVLEAALVDQRTKLLVDESLHSRNTLFELLGVVLGSQRR